MIRSIPTTYRGVRLKSRLEADAAFLIDRMGYPWKYEPQSFLLPDGTHYMPDFWVPGLGLWIECRGYESAQGEQQIAGFRDMVRGNPKFDEAATDDRAMAEIPGEYLVLTTQKVPRFYEAWASFGTGGGEASIAQCEKCERWFFLSMDGHYRCRACGAWDGDHHLKHVDAIEADDGKITMRCYEDRPGRYSRMGIQAWLQAHSLL